MKALTLTQPYAFLVADLLKRYETRSWTTNYRGPIAIHAASTLNGVGGKAGFLRLLDELPEGIGARIRYWYGTDWRNMELGAVVALSWLEDVELIDYALREHLDEDELAVGNYQDGRYAWRLREPIRITPVKATGHLGLWDMDDELLPEKERKANRHPGAG